jgi:hypothetical protein
MDLTFEVIPVNLNYIFKQKKALNSYHIIICVVCPLYNYFSFCIDFAFEIFVLFFLLENRSIWHEYNNFVHSLAAQLTTTEL